MHRFILSAVDTDALVLKHQVISIHNAGKMLIVVGQLQSEILRLLEQQ